MLESYPVLIAEDSRDDIWLLNKALRKAAVPCIAHYVRDGEEAIRWLKGVGLYTDRGQFPLPRLLITDLKMPRLDGFELIKWVRAQAQFTHLPILVFSSSDLANDVERACSLGANCCIRKSTDCLKAIQYLRETLCSL